MQIGIVGTGRIAPRFLEEAKYVSGTIPVAAYNPDWEQVRDFEEKHKELICVDDYDSLLTRVDAVYIASPNETHFDYVLKALQNGVHVISEKPLAFTRSETEQLYSLAEKNNLVLLEAVKAAYSPGFQELINVAKSGRIGEIRDIESNYTRLANPKSRERTDAMYGGAFLEFGPSVMLPVIKLLGSDYRSISFHSLWDENGVDIYNKLDFVYDNALATTKCGVAVKTEGQLVVSGTKGYILAPSPWWLMKHFEVHYEDASEIENYDPPFRGDGLRYEISEFVRKINGIGRDGYKLTRGESITMSEITEKYMEYKRSV